MKILSKSVVPVAFPMEWDPSWVFYYSGMRDWDTTDLYYTERGGRTCVKVVCEDVISFRYSVEESRNGLMAQAADWPPGLVFRCTGGSFLEELLADSAGLIDRQHVRHFCIMSGDEMVDIACLGEVSILPVPDATRERLRSRHEF